MINKSGSEPSSARETLDSKRESELSKNSSSSDPSARNNDLQSPSRISVTPSDERKNVVDLPLRLPDLLGGILRQRATIAPITNLRSLIPAETQVAATPVAPITKKDPQTPSPAAIIEEISRELPVGIELHRTYHYQVPFEKKARLDLFVVKLYCPTELEHKLDVWRRRMDDRFDSVTILVRRVTVDRNIHSHLKNRFRSKTVLTNASRPVLKSMLDSLCGAQPSAPTATRPHLPKREDLTDVPFVAIDRFGTSDAEDLVHAQWQNGTLTFRAAYINATDFVHPGSQIDKFALRVGSTIYGRTLAIPTLGSKLAYGPVSFVEGAARPAWVIEGRLTPYERKTNSGKTRTEYTLRYKVRSAYVVNHKNVDPKEPIDAATDERVSRCLAALTDAARILERRRTAKPSLLRIEGEDAASKVLAEIMIESKRILAQFLGSYRKAPTIFRVHTKPAAQVVSSFVEKLGALGIPAHAGDFDKPSEFAGILRALENQNTPPAQALLNSLIDTYLLRSHYSTNNDGHFGLRLDGYLEIKPRDASGLANQYQLAALFEGREPLSEAEMARRATTLNEKRWRRDEVNYKLRFLEMLHDKLQHVGNKAFFGKVAREGGRPYIEVEGFSKWGMLHGRIPEAPLAKDSPVVVTLKGFHLRYMRFIFELLQ